MKSRVGSISEMTKKLREVAGTFLSWGTTTFGAVRLALRLLRKNLVELRVVVGRVGPSYEELKVEQRLNRASVERKNNVASEG